MHWNDRKIIWNQTNDIWQINNIKEWILPLSVICNQWSCSWTHSGIKLVNIICEFCNHLRTPYKVKAYSYRGKTKLLVKFSINNKKEKTLTVSWTVKYSYHHKPCPFGWWVAWYVCCIVEAFLLYWHGTVK